MRMGSCFLPLDMTETGGKADVRRLGGKNRRVAGCGEHAKRKEDDAKRRSTLRREENQTVSCISFVRSSATPEDVCAQRTLPRSIMAAEWRACRRTR
jgi:hypothetical protein